MQGSSYTKSRLPPKVVFHPRSYSTDSCLPLKVIFHRRSSSTDGCLPLKVAFHQRLSSTEGCLSPKAVFHQRSSSIEGRLPPKVIFHRRLSSAEGHLPPKGVFLQRASSINHNTLVGLIFVITVNIPNLSLLPSLEVVFHQMSSSSEGRLPPKVVFQQPYHLGWSYICENSQHTKHQHPTLLRSVLKFFWTYTRNERTKPYVEAACCLKSIIL